MKLAIVCYHIIQHRQDERVKALAEEFRLAQEEAERQHAEAVKNDARCRLEITVNNELCDLCRAAGINFRPALDRARGR